MGLSVFKLLVRDQRPLGNITKDATSSAVGDHCERLLKSA